MEVDNASIIEFATELSKLVKQNIGLDHIHVSTEGRYYYIQAPKPGAPMLLHHYRGPFFVDINPEDFKKISSEEISANDYIMSANWQVGYYWGGGPMIGGGYYQPLDIVNCKEEVRRYLQILSCRGYQRSCGYMPSEKKCTSCFVENCPFSKYKNGKWENEMSEPDARLHLFNALKERFEREYPGYTMQGFSCAEIPRREVWLNPLGHYIEEEPFAFTVCVSDSLIQSLLMREVGMNDWGAFAKNFQFRVHSKMFDGQTEEVTQETLKNACDEMDYVKKANTQPEDVSEEKVPLMTRMMTFFKKMF